MLLGNLEIFWANGLVNPNDSIFVPVRVCWMQEFVFEVHLQINCDSKLSLLENK